MKELIHSEETVQCKRRHSRISEGHAPAGVSKYVSNRSDHGRHPVSIMISIAIFISEWIWYGSCAGTPSSPASALRAERSIEIVGISTELSWGGHRFSLIPQHKG